MMLMVVSYANSNPGLGLVSDFNLFINFHVLNISIHLFKTKNSPFLNVS